MKTRIQNAVAASAALLALAAPAGTVSFPAAPAELPASVQAKVAFWLKGDANLVTDSSGNVVAWCDAREAAVADEAAYAARVAAGSWTYPRAIVYTSGAAPSDAVPVGADAPESFGGKPYVDFGEYHDNKWMLFVDAAGARKRVNLVGYAGYIGFGATAGFVVGDVNDPDILAQSATGVGDNGAQYFHKGAGGSGNDAIFADRNGIGRHGETRKNGHVVKSTQNDNENRHVRNGWEVFVQNGPNQEMFVSTLFNNGNFKASVDASYTDRQGGGKVAEIMLFSEMLTQSEVAEVEAYLRARWQGGSGSATSTLALAAGDTLTVSAAAPAFVGDIAGAGAIEKTGSSSLTIDRGGRLAAGALALREGSVVSFGKRAHHAPLLAIGGKTVTATAATLSVRDDGDADTFTVNESAFGRRVSLADAESGVKKIAVSKAAAVLTPPALPPAAVATVEDPAFLSIGNLIQNGSFEDDTITATAGYKQGLTPAGWIRSTHSNTAVSTVGITSTSDTSAWLNGSVAPGEVADGTKALILQVQTKTATNGITQTVNIPSSGLYELSAYIRCRQRGNGTNSVPVWVFIDNSPVLVRYPWRVGSWDSNSKQFVTDGSETELKFKKVCVDVALSAGEHTFELLAVNHSGSNGHTSVYDRALLVDDVRLVPKAEGNFIFLADGSFSSCNYWNSGEINSNNGGNLSKNASPFWTFSGNGGYSRYPSTWFCNPIYDGVGEDQQLYLQNGGTASQTVTFPKAGRVRVSCRYAKRSDRLDTGAARAGGQTFSISLGGAVIGSAVVTNADFSTLVAEGEVSAGAQTLVLSGGSVSGSDVSTILDDVRIEYVGGTDRIVEDAAFADGSSTWTMDGAVTESDAFGLRELVFTGTASATASFTVPTNGYYLLSFQSRGRPLSESGTDGVYHNYRFYSHNLNVRVDDAYFANYYNEAADIHPVEMRLPYLPAGEHTITFAGSSDSFVATTAQSRISDVTVTPISTGSMADWSGVEFELADGATIAAELGGKVRLGKLRVDGAAQYGSFTAANSAFVTGAGTVEVVPAAFVLVVK